MRWREKGRRGGIGVCMLHIACCMLHDKILRKRDRERKIKIGECELSEVSERKMKKWEKIEQETVFFCVYVMHMYDVLDFIEKRKEMITGTTTQKKHPWEWLKQKRKKKYYREEKEIKSCFVSLILSFQTDLWLGFFLALHRYTHSQFLSISITHTYTQKTYNLKHIHFSVSTAVLAFAFAFAFSCFKRGLVVSFCFLLNWTPRQWFPTRA
jgi:hypothetical protein